MFLQARPDRGGEAQAAEQVMFGEVTWKIKRTMGIGGEKP